MGVYGCMGAWMYVCMGCMGVWMCVWVYGWCMGVCAWVCVYGYMRVWVYGCGCMVVCMMVTAECEDGQEICAVVPLINLHKPFQ